MTRAIKTPLWIPSPTSLPGCFFLSRSVILQQNTGCLLFWHIKAVTPRAQRRRWNKSHGFPSWKFLNKCSRAPPSPHTPFSFLTSPQMLHIYACMDEWMHTPLLLAAPLYASAESIWRKEDVPLTFHSDTVLVSSHCFALYIYLI